MNIYLVCKHRTFRDAWGHGVYRDFTIEDYFHSKTIAQVLVKQLNSRAKKYWYSIKKLEVEL